MLIVKSDMKLVPVTRVVCTMRRSLAVDTNAATTEKLKVAFNAVKNPEAELRDNENLDLFSQLRTREVSLFLWSVQTPEAFSKKLKC